MDKTKGGLFVEDRLKRLLYQEYNLRDLLFLENLRSSLRGSMFLEYPLDAVPFKRTSRKNYLLSRPLDKNSISTKTLEKLYYSMKDL